MSIAYECMNVSIRFGIRWEPIDLGTEVMRVGLRSVQAGVNTADDNRQRFPLGTCER